MNTPPRRLTRWLAQAPTPAFMLVATLSAFSTYFCMYAFRKPFSAATFEGLLLWGVELKTCLIASQVIGYTLSKFLGIRFCSEVTRQWRSRALIGCIVVAQAALLLFAVLPNNLKVVAIFINGLPLGMVWGLVCWYLEGRRTSEMLLAGLSCSYIVASSSVKVVGSWLMGQGISEFWMPFSVGGLFTLPFLASVWLLNQLPEPTPEDVAARTERQPMDSAARWRFLQQFALGMILLCVFYFFLTAYRDFRDSFMPEIFADLGYQQGATMFAQADWPIAFAVMLSLAGINWVKDNRRGLLTVFAVMAIGMVMMLVSTLLIDAGQINGLTWMILVGLGAYLAYVPFGSVLFDRLIAATGFVGTAVFAIYLTDAVGYTGTVSLMFFKDLLQPDMSRLDFFRYLTYFLSLSGFLMVIGSGAYFFLYHTQSGSRGDTEPPLPTADTADHSGGEKDRT